MSRPERLLFALLAVCTAALHADVALAAAAHTHQKRAVGHRYQIGVALPFEKSPAAGYPVLYVLDGNEILPLAALAARAFGLVPIVVVGIGYPEDSAYTASVLKQRGPLPKYRIDRPPAIAARSQERIYDLTLPAGNQQLAAQTLRGIPAPSSENVGGVDDLLKTIELEVKPRVAWVATIDPVNQALFGPSLGGLAGLRALFIEPRVFRTLVISSPSIWWKDGAVLAEEGNFARMVQGGAAQPRVLISVGREESAPIGYNFPVAWGIDREAANARQLADRMVENSRDLAKRLSGLHGGPDYRVEYALFDKVGHALAPFFALARAIPCAFAEVSSH